MDFAVPFGVMLKRLVDEGFLEKNQDGEYFFVKKNWRMGHE
jgi:DNA-binding IclR family transcriptional regulator